MGPIFLNWGHAGIIDLKTCFCGNNSFSWLGEGEGEGVRTTIQVG